MKIQVLKSSLLAGIALAFTACAGRQVTRPVTSIDPQSCVETTTVLTQKINHGKTITLNSERIGERINPECTAHQRQITINNDSLLIKKSKLAFDVNVIAISLKGSKIEPALRAVLIKQALRNLQSRDSTIVQAQSAALAAEGLSVEQLRAEDALNARAGSCVSVKNNETGGVTITCSKPHAAPAKPGAPEPQ
jgi:hypothetical protein